MSRMYSKESHAVIYVRSHESYCKYDLYKIGKSTNLAGRDNTYATDEYKRGVIVAAYAMRPDYLDIVDKLLKKALAAFNRRLDGGTELFTKDAVQHIEPLLNRINLVYYKLTPDEITELVNFRPASAPMADEPTFDELLCQFRASQYICGDLMAPATTKEGDTMTTTTTTANLIPRADQTPIISKTVAHFQTNSKGLLVLMCGVGKTLISLWAAQQLQARHILIGVPNLLLLDQWQTAVSRVFPALPIMCISGGNISSDQIAQFCNDNPDGYAVIVLYASAHKVLQACTGMAHTFDIKILDEVHHLTSTNADTLQEKDRCFVKMLNIPATLQLGLTATLKVLSGGGAAATPIETMISNDNVAHFGDVIHKTNLFEAIAAKVVCDYVLQTVVANEEQFDATMAAFGVTDDTEKRLLLAAYVGLKSIATGATHHLLTYCNNRANADKINRYIDALCQKGYFTITGFAHNTYYSDMPDKDKAYVLDVFKRLPSGIICSVYCLGEGWDLPLLDGVVFAENMTSNIRILQSALRPCRRDVNNPEKEGKILLPVLNIDDVWGDAPARRDLDKVREVVYQMGLEDTAIIQKMKAIKLDMVALDDPQRKHHARESAEATFEVYDAELTDKIRLRTTARAAFGMTYDAVVRALAPMGITSKAAYRALCERDIRFAGLEDPAEVFNKRFTNWVDYLGIPRNNGRYYDYATVCNNLRMYLSNNKRCDLDIAIHNLCAADVQYPPAELWADYYRIKTVAEMIEISRFRRKLDKLPI